MLIGNLGWITKECFTVVINIIITGIIIVIGSYFFLILRDIIFNTAPKLQFSFYLTKFVQSIRTYHERDIIFHAPRCIQESKKDTPYLGVPHEEDL